MSRTSPTAESRETGWLTADERAAWLSIIGVASRLLPALDAQLERDAELNFFEYSVLAMLSEQPDRRLGMTDLARVTSSSLSRLSHVAKRLERAGLVGRATDPADARCTIVNVTDAGIDAIVAAAPGHVDFVRRAIFDGLSDEQVAQLRRLNDEILERLAPGSSGEPFTRTDDSAAGPSPT